MNQPRHRGRARLADILVADFRRAGDELGATLTAAPSRGAHEPHQRGRVC